MSPVSPPLRFLLVALAGWIHQQQRDVIDYLQGGEPRVAGAARPPARFTDDQRVRLAAKANTLMRYVPSTSNVPSLRMVGRGNWPWPHPTARLQAVSATDRQAPSPVHLLGGIAPFARKVVSLACPFNFPITSTKWIRDGASGPLEANWLATLANPLPFGYNPQLQEDKFGDIESK